MMLLKILNLSSDPHGLWCLRGADHNQKIRSIQSCINISIKVAGNRQFILVTEHLSQPLCSIFSEPQRYAVMFQQSMQSFGYCSVKFHMSVADKCNITVICHDSCSPVVQPSVLTVIFPENPVSAGRSILIITPSRRTSIQRSCS